MVRSYWKGTLVVALAWPGLVWGQQPPAAAPAAAPAVAPVPASSDEFMTVQEAGKPPQKCRILKSYQLPDGHTAREVQDVVSGEIMTIVDTGAAVSSHPIVGAPHGPVLGSRLFHRDDMVAHGPCDTCTSGAPCTSTCQSGTPCTSTCQSCAPCTTTCQGPAPCCTTTGQPGRVVAMPASDGGHMTPMPMPSAVVEYPHVPFWKRWFGKDEIVQPAPTVVVKPTQPTTPGVKPTTAVTTTKPAVDSAQPTDWRRSWGKPETTQADAKKTDDDKSKKVWPTWPNDYSSARAPVKTDSTAAKTDKPDANKPAKPDTTASKPATPAKPEVASASKPKSDDDKDKAKTPPTSLWSKNQTPSKSNEPPGTVKGGPTSSELAHADTSKTDPLNNPDRYSKKPLDTKLQEPGKSMESKPAAETKAVASDKNASKVSQVSTTVQHSVAAPGVASTEPYIPLGARSVAAAYGGPMGQVCYMPVPMMTLPQALPPGSTRPAMTPPPPPPEPAKPDENQVNAFTPTPQRVAQATNTIPNAFSTSGPPQQVVMIPPGMMMPMPPAGPIAQVGYFPPAYPQPYGPGYPGMVPAGFNPMMPAPPVCPPQAPPMAAGNNAGQLMLTLRDAMYPSHREWAAEAMASTTDWRSNPQVVDALVLAAREDPAATVRASCVRCLGRMNVNTTAAVATIQGLKADTDPRVRTAVDQALASMGIHSAPADLTPAPAVQPASAVEPAPPK